MVYHIKTHNVEHRKIVLKWLISKGFLWHGRTDESNVDQIEKDWPYSRWPYLNIRKDNREISGNRVSPDQLISLIELKNELDKGVIQR